MSQNQLDAKMFKEMFLAGAKNLESKKEYINELNVFPVPDGDSGTNMTLTIMSAAKEVASLDENATLKELSKAISSGSLRGARGNSGVILSQLLRGLCKVIGATEGEITVDVLIAAFEKAVEIGCDVKQAANWINGMILSYLNTNEISIKDFSMTEEDLKELIDLIESKTISSKQGKDVFYKCLEDKKSPKQVVKDEGMMQITDSSEIESVIDEVINENLDQAKTYDPENPRILDFFVGQVMKKTRGKANPAMSREMLAKKLEELVK